MYDATAVLVSNLSEALKQSTNYLTIGLATAVSAFVLDRRPEKRRKAKTSGADPGADATDPAEEATEEKEVGVPGLPISVGPETAKMLLLGLCWVAGAMASYAIDSANKVAAMLQSQPDVLKAACSFPSLATAPIFYAIAAATLPLAFVLPVMWRLHKTIKGDTASLLLVFLIPYGAVALALWNFSCR